MSNTPYNGFTPPPPTPRSVPSGVVSPMPNPPSFPLGLLPTPPSRNHTSFVLPPSSLPSDAALANSQPPAPPSIPSDLELTPNPPSFGTPNRLPSESLHHLDGLANPNISGYSPPHPNRLDRNFCAVGCQKFYVVTVGWEVGIFNNWGIARTRVGSISNNSHQSFSNWEQAVVYYTQCFTDNCVEICDPKFPTPNKPLSRAQAVPLATFRRDFTPDVGTESRPITVTPSSPTPRGISTAVLTANKTRNSKTRIKKGKAPQNDGPIIILSSDSEDSDPGIPFTAKRSIPARAPSPAPVIGCRRRIVIIDELGEDIELSDTDGKPCRETKRYRMAVHTMRVKQVVHQVPSTSKALVPGQPVPLPVHLYNVSVNRSEAGLAGPSGTIAVPPVQQSRSKSPRTPNHSDSDYPVTDFEPEVLAALCKGM